MPNAVRPLTDAEIMAGLVLVDPFLFRMYWFRDEFTLPPTKEQKMIFCDESDKVLLCTGRKVAKTVSLEAMVLQSCIVNKAEVEGGMDEALFFTPGEAHLTPFLDRLFGRIAREPVLRGFFKIRRGEAPILDSQSLRVYFRVEGLSGTDRNMVGLRAKYIWGDELAFGSTVCHNSRLQTALPDCKWLYAGVPNGVRNTPFWRIDQTNEGLSWSRHKYATFINPLYQSRKAHKELERAYGGVHTQGYITQVLGEWGDELLSSFPPGSLAVHSAPYFIKSLGAISKAEEIADLPLMLGIPAIRCHSYCLGVDYGYSPDPTEIIGAYKEKEDDQNWMCYVRIELKRVAMPRQVDIILYVIRNIFFGEFAGLSSDNISLIQSLQSEDRANQDFYLWSAPAGMSKVEIIEQGVTKEVSVRNKEHFTNTLKKYFINAVVGLIGTRLWIGEDPEAVNELMGTTEKKTAGGYTVYYGPSDPKAIGSAGQLDHIRDSLTYLCHAVSLSLLGQITGGMDELLAELGWVGEAGWTPLQNPEK